MKQYVFSPIDNSFKVSYLTNGIADNDRLFINEIKSEVNGVITPGLCDAAKALDLPHDYLETTVTALVAKAVAKGLNLFVFEDRHSEANLNETLANFLTYSIPNADVVVDHDAETIEISMKQGTVVTALVASFTLTNEATAAIGATAQVSGVTQNNFTSPKEYVVTAKDETTTKTYTATVTLRLARFATFSIDGQNTAAVINHGAGTIAVHVDFGTTVTALVAAFTTLNDAIVLVGSDEQESEVTENDFTNPVVYRVKIVDDNTYTDYTVTVTVDPE